MKFQIKKKTTEVSICGITNSSIKRRLKVVGKYQFLLDLLEGKKS